MQIVQEREGDVINEGKYIRFFRRCRLAFFTVDKRRRTGNDGENELGWLTVLDSTDVRESLSMCDLKSSMHTPRPTTRLGAGALKDSEQITNLLHRSGFIPTRKHEYDVKANRVRRSLSLWISSTKEETDRGRGNTAWSSNMHSNESIQWTRERRRRRKGEKRGRISSQFTSSILPSTFSLNEWKVK